MLYSWSLYRICHDVLTLSLLQSYKLLARNTADFLIPMVTAVEWATWKNQLDQVKYDKTLYD